MKRLFAPLFVVLALAAPAAAENRSLSDFRAVSAEDRLTVTISIGDRSAVEITGADAQRVRTRVDRNGVLRIEDAHRPWLRNPRLDAHVSVTTPSIDRVAAARGAEVVANLSGGQCEELSVAAAMGGSASVTAAQCARVSSAAAMGGEVRIAGACRTHRASASMGGFVRADELACETVDASASMGGDIRAFASRSYDASASMGGAIDMEGGGDGQDIAASMGGSVSRQ